MITNIFAGSLKFGDKWYALRHCCIDHRGPDSFTTAEIPRNSISSTYFFSFFPKKVSSRLVVWKRYVTQQLLSMWCEHGSHAPKHFRTSWYDGSYLYSTVQVGARRVLVLRNLSRSAASKDRELTHIIVSKNEKKSSPSFPSPCLLPEFIRRHHPSQILHTYITTSIEKLFDIRFKVS